MKQYPSISKITKDHIPNMPFICFSKKDGSQIRGEYNPKRGFYKFGTRHELIDHNSKPFGQAISLVKNKYENDIGIICKAKKWESVICFFEFWGEQSFAGNHNFDEPMDVTLFDAAPYKRGILPPKEFIAHFGYLDIPQICYNGIITPEVFDLIKQSKLPNIGNEGIVAKGEEDNHPIMFKIKTQAWLDKLKTYCKDDEKLFNILE
jgi:hypothetical protein